MCYKWKSENRTLAATVIKSNHKLGREREPDQNHYYLDIAHGAKHEIDSVLIAANISCWEWLTHRVSDKINHKSWITIFHNFHTIDMNQIKCTLGECTFRNSDARFLYWRPVFYSDTEWDRHTNRRSLYDAQCTNLISPNRITSSSSHSFKASSNILFKTVSDSFVLTGVYYGDTVCANYQGGDCNSQNNFLTRILTGVEVDLVHKLFQKLKYFSKKSSTK